MYFRIDTREKNTKCCLCNKHIRGKQQEFCYRISKNGCGVNFCSQCLRNLANTIDQDNSKLKVYNLKEQTKAI